MGRIVLDGAEDSSLSQGELRLTQAAGFQLAFEDYIADCLSGTCSLGSSKEDIEQKVADLLTATATEPLKTDDPERSLEQALALCGITGPLYAQDEWPSLTDALVDAFGGDGTKLLAISDSINERGTDSYSNNLNQVNAAINCLDATLKPEPATSPTEDDFVKASPLFGRLVAGFSAQCDEWPIKPTVEAPDYTAAGAAPILVVGTTGDPATPYDSAVKLAETLESGVLLTRDGEGHTAYLSGNSCITEAITGYLVDGTVPKDGTEWPPRPRRARLSPPPHPPRRVHPARVDTAAFGPTTTAIPHRNALEHAHLTIVVRVAMRECDQSVREWRRERFGDDVAIQLTAGGQCVRDGAELPDVAM